MKRWVSVCVIMPVLARMCIQVRGYREALSILLALIALSLQEGRSPSVQTASIVWKRKQQNLSDC